MPLKSHISWLLGMSAAGMETSVAGEAAGGGGGGGAHRKRDSLGASGSPVHPIIKDLGEIHSRLLDHRPVIQGEICYFVKEFEEKRGLRETRVLENWRNAIHETDEHTLPGCRDAMQGHLDQVLQRLQTATDTVCRLQQREQERKQIHSDHVTASENRRVAQWDDFLSEQRSQQADVDEQHRRAMERLRAQYAEMEKDLAKFTAF